LPAFRPAASFPTAQVRHPGPDPILPVIEPDGSILVSVPIIVKRKPLRTEIVPEAERDLLPLQFPVVKAIAQGRIWAQGMREGTIRDVTAIMEMTGWDRCRVIRILGLSTLSTAIVSAYCTGVEPDGLGLGRLARQVPMRWWKQHEKFGCTPPRSRPKCGTRIEFFGERRP